MWVKLFGFGLAGGVVLTSIAMAWLGGRWQKIESSAYAGKKRPLWFWLISLLVIVLYAAAMASFITGEKTWAGWLLMVVIPLGWLAKAGMVIFNPKGRSTVSSISGDKSWVAIAAARLPVALLLAALAWLA